MAAVDITIILCTYNRAEMLEGALESIICQETEGKFSYEILVVDDGSTDETKQVVEDISRSSPVSLKYVQEESKGYTHAMNRGVNESRGKWLAFFDDDELANPDWLKELFSVAVNELAQGVGGCRVLAISETELSTLGPVCRTLLGEEGIYPEARKCNSKPLPGGGNILLNRTVFDSIGPFDETFVTGGCDADLVRRALAAGFNIWWAPKAVVRHMITSDRITPDQIKWYSLQLGCSFALIDNKQWGRSKTFLICIARIGQSLFVNLPLLLLGYITRSQIEILDRKALLWRAIGYTRKTLHLLAPKLFSQEGVFARLQFREGRHLSQNVDEAGWEQFENK